MKKKKLKNSYRSVNVDFEYITFVIYVIYNFLLYIKLYVELKKTIIKSSIQTPCLVGATS